MKNSTEIPKRMKQFPLDAALIRYNKENSAERESPDMEEVRRTSKNGFSNVSCNY
jgi:hypothetical protein